MLKGFGGLGGLGDMGNMLRQAMEMKKKMEELKERLGEVQVEGSAGGGMVEVLMTGKMEVLQINIDPVVIDPAQKEMLETLVQAAMNEAINRAQQLMKDQIKEMTGGIDIPGIT